eukprot:GHVS01044880.1.p1 GENE.GHVS01044880.1~~GHVS01044880.1.p1  ORF type:complete len:284 (+),score=28.06 GHVS01044880.1:303-1154(+)
MWRGTCVTAHFRMANNNNNEQLLLLQECVVRMSRLRHPNIVLFIGCCTTTQPLCVVTEYCQGPTLFDLLHQKQQQHQKIHKHKIGTSDHKTDDTKRNRTTTTTDGQCCSYQLTWRQRIRIAVDVAQGCTYMHSSQPLVMHRDLNSLNILLSEPVTHDTDIPNAKISYFGLSRFTKQCETVTAGWAGTLYWMAPEILSNSCCYNEKIDVYSFGIILYELLSLCLPYPDVHTLTNKHLAHQIVNNGLRPDMSKSLMLRCLSRTPQCRPAFGEVLYELRCIQADVA